MDALVRELDSVTAKIKLGTSMQPQIFEVSIHGY
jgi:hypothetical protein